MKKKVLLVAGLSVLAICLVSAAILVYYGQINQNVNVQQAVVLSGDCDTLNNNVCTRELGTVYSPDTILSGVYTLTNKDPAKDREVNLSRTSCLPDCDGITTTYLELIPYSYDKNHEGVGVVVTDEGEWLKWTYTYAENPTHTPKMTVAIDYYKEPVGTQGFAITTFDDGSHDGWYYAPDPDQESTRVRLGNYSGYDGSTPGYDWVKTTAEGNVLTVSIKKSKLNDAFTWHGYANYNGNQVWIGENGSSYGNPPINATIREEIVNPITVPKDNGKIFFVIRDEFQTSGDEDYTLTTEAIPA